MCVYLCMCMIYVSAAAGDGSGSGHDYYLSLIHSVNSTGSLSNSPLLPSRWYTSHVAFEAVPVGVPEQCSLLIPLGVYLSVVPVDWLSLVIHMPFMVLYSDIRQGLFYCVLLCFWIIFAGEHMMVCLSVSSNSRGSSSRLVSCVGIM